ncbi:hypothetical protein TSAR_009127 [Trichomalopsis sarcophagae]|uniref:Uncharacterized protein n=1 Tax=Trichomalopsis sarcophagae TaxID=543379 RepID=A0A232F1Q4_9HYME|nr:hypothetical protein TSAR_009127 [Trichomalopsis sarcophagae]
MATTSTVPWYSNHERGSSTMMPMSSSTTTTCPPSNFPDKFQDFFAALSEDVDDLPSMLEDKLIPRSDIVVFNGEQTFRINQGLLNLDGSLR